MIAEPDDDLLAKVVHGLDGLGLDEMNDRAALLARKDRKYLVPVGALAGILSSVDGPLRVLDIGGGRRFGYDTTYLDTPARSSYRDAARGRPNRWKVRLRTYTDSGAAWVEVKLRDRRGDTVKHRSRRDVNRPDLAGHERFFVGRWVPDVAALRATATTTFERITLLDSTTESRVTVDLSLRCTTVDGRAVALPTTAVIETKTAGRASIVDRALWAAGYRPDRFSKYCTGLAAITGMPANRWHRTLRQAPFTHLPTPEQES